MANFTPTTAPEATNVLPLPLPPGVAGPIDQQPASHMAELPDNVTFLREQSPRWVPDPPRPLSPEGMVLLAMIEAMSDRRRGRRYANKVLDALAAMGPRFRDDPPVRAQIAPAINIVCAPSTGRA